MPRIHTLARALLGWAPWALLPVYLLSITGDVGAAALALAFGATMFFLFYRLSPDPPPTAAGPLKRVEVSPGTLTVPLEEPGPLRPARDITDDPREGDVVAGPVPVPGRLTFEIATAPAFIAFGYFERSVEGFDWAGAFLYAGLSSAALFAIVAPVASLVSRPKPAGPPDSRDWGPLIPLAAAAVALFFLVFGAAGFQIVGTAALGLIVCAFIIQDYKDAWNGTGRHRRKY